MSGVALARPHSTFSCSGNPGCASCIPTGFPRRLVLLLPSPESSLPGLGAVWNAAKVEPGSTVAIFGLGTVGLAVRGPSPYLQGLEPGAD